jgi:CheY-like chemotaxis protein
MSQTHQRDVNPADSRRANADERAPLRILVVDDNIDAAETLAMLLGLGGHVTRVAHSGEEALDLATAFLPRLALIDIGLPGIDGYEVARRLRQAPTAGPLQLIALTGRSTEEDRRQAHAAGFDLHLVKPVDFDRLTDVIKGMGPV